MRGETSKLEWEEKQVNYDKKYKKNIILFSKIMRFCASQINMKITHDKIVSSTSLRLCVFGCKDLSLSKRFLF